MCNIQLYKRINKLQRWLCKSLMAEFSHRFKWLDDGRDSLLDIGCGPGDVTADFILSALPPQFSRIVCADISDKMLNAARQTVRSPNASFEILDIGKPLDTNVWTKPFDHITSFSALHWAPDKQQTMENIYNLLKPGANCFLMFLSNWSIFTVANELANHPKWASRLPDIDRHLPSYQFSSNSAKELESIMQNVGFSEFEIEVRDQCTQFDGIDHLKCKYSNRTFTF